MPTSGKIGNIFNETVFSIIQLFEIHARIVVTLAARRQSEPETGERRGRRRSRIRDSSIVIGSELWEDL
jgi:hypothetical protein